MDLSPPDLPVGMSVLERGWLSANSIVFLPVDGGLKDDLDSDTAGAAVVDTGYVSHAAQTLALIEAQLGDLPLTRILNTHLHSDHCGGNALLQKRWPAVQTLIAPGQAELVRQWNAEALGYAPTGQDCPQFAMTTVLAPGSTLRLSGRDWQVHAAAGHDPHSIILFEPQSRVLISADALWENGFGVVFPEIEGIAAFDEVAATLDVIEKLQPATVIPGHGSVFNTVAEALAVARRRLDGFVRAPERHASYAAKVLIKYKLLDWQSIALTELQAWVQSTHYLRLLHERYFADEAFDAWLERLVNELITSKAAVREVNAQGQQTLANI